MWAKRLFTPTRLKRIRRIKPIPCAISSHDLNAGKVDLLLILGANPIYDAPADFNFADAITKAKLRVHSGLYADETAELCQWHAPGTHYLESWSDTRAYDGTVGIVQPLIAPLYDGHSAHELIALARDRRGRSPDTLWCTITG